MRKVRGFFVFFLRNYPDVNVSKTHWDRTFFFFFFNAWHLKVLLGCKTKKMLLKLSIIVWPILEMKPVFPWPMSHTQSHAAKSSSLCSLAAEVQMVCLHASLTQCRSFTSALLCLVLLDSVHHSSTPDTLLGFALSSSLCHTFQLSHSFFLSPCSLKNTV